MAYNASYDSDDLSPVIFDGIVKGILAVVSFVVLIVLVVLYGWFKKNVR